MFDTLTAFVEANAAAPWVLGLVLLVAAGDALVPPVPSEGVVVALAAVSVASQGPSLVLLALAAATGAFLGDTAAFLAGRTFGAERLARIRRPLLRRGLDLAASTLRDRGGLVILAARYVPVGRLAVGLTAGATGYPPRRFVPFAVLAATTWAAWTVGIGALAGRWFTDHALLAAGAGIGVALVLGVLADHVGRRVLGRRRAAGADSGVAQQGGAPAPRAGH